ncbi:uncharacterized protein LOC121254487 [Juglans microcarpa x Juglans regia]|uniref:uncharacterized protein LOC121254487 n=1 Tax=Juglans microcarpa x Juglans regia TaxID=2249226 RepID=UPI001B7E4630|nr:uncharacterized protein LOC121254487 [Juglans microcarpa x Juglans regia]
MILHGGRGKLHRHGDYHRALPIHPLSQVGTPTQTISLALKPVKQSNDVGELPLIFLTQQKPGGSPNFLDIVILIVEGSQLLVVEASILSAQPMHGVLVSDLMGDSATAPKLVIHSDCEGENGGSLKESAIFFSFGFAFTRLKRSQLFVKMSIRSGVKVTIVYSINPTSRLLMALQARTAVVEEMFLSTLFPAALELLRPWGKFFHHFMAK